MDNKNKISCCCCKSPKIIALCILSMAIMFGLFYFLFYKNVSFKIEKTNSATQTSIK